MTTQSTHPNHTECIEETGSDPPKVVQDLQTYECMIILFLPYNLHDAHRDCIPNITITMPSITALPTCQQISSLLVQSKVCKIFWLRCSLIELKRPQGIFFHNPRMPSSREGKSLILSLLLMNSLIVVGSLKWQGFYVSWT